MNATLQFALLLIAVLGAVALCAKPLGAYIADVMEGRAAFVRGPGARLERALYRICGIDPAAEMGWARYAFSLLTFNFLGTLLLYALQRLQAWLPLNPQRLGAVSADSSFNTAISFVTNTNWQGYAGESTMGYLVQMAGLTVQNFLSAATGLAVAIAMVRGFARASVAGIGNFWVDVTRATLYLLLPLSLIFSLVLLSQGVIQNLSAYRDVTTIESLNGGTQTLPMGPVASQESIKELGTNGGGFFNANSSHPYENPTQLTNLLQLIAILLIPFALTHTFGRMVGDTRQGWAVMAAMMLILVVMAAAGFHAEQQGNPAQQQGNPQVAAVAPAGNLEGKEVRFGIAASTLYAAATTATSTGAVNSMHDSMTPMGGFVPIFLMQLGELVPGGVGTGLYTVLVFAILGVFIAGLMIGRTPEYLGKKIEAREMKLASIFILITPFLVLLGTALAVVSNAGVAGIANPGAHGFSEILYAFTSAGNNNGSCFCGLSANTPFYNVSLGIVMWLGRFWPIIAALAIAGSLAAKKRIPVTEGTMPTHGPLFISLLIGTIVLIGVLNYVPALALGPVAEHFMMQAIH